jgi:hypothetical protein
MQSINCCPSHGLGKAHRCPGSEGPLLTCPLWNRPKEKEQFSLETALEYIEDDELVEVTPKSIRLRKTYLKENDRKRLARAEKG